MTSTTLARVQRLRGVMPAFERAVARGLALRGVRSRSVDGLHYLDLLGRGSSPPVVLLHGLGATALDWWRCLIELAASSSRVLAVDLPGTGRSPLPVGGPLRLEELAATFARFLDALGLDRPVVVGNSLGGLLSLRVALDHPERLGSLVLVAPAGAHMSAAQLSSLVRSYRVESPGEARALMGRLFARPPRLLPLLVGGDLFHRFTRPHITHVLDEVAAAGVTAAFPAAEVATLRTPTLLLWGREERILPYENVDWFRAHLPAVAEVREVVGFGHCPHLDRPLELAAMIADHTRRHSQGVQR